jgi:hypothetical protein
MKRSNEPEHPWTPVIELPLKHKETGEEFILTCQSKTAIRATRKHYSAEDKIRIAFDGLRGEYSIAELCRREGIAATTDEVRELRRRN